MNWIPGVATVLCLTFFVGVCIWAFSRGRSQANRESADLPFALPDEADEPDKRGLRHATDPYGALGLAARSRE